MLNLLRTLRTNLFILPLVRLGYRLKLHIYKKAANLQTLVLTELKSRIRLGIQEARLEGHDEEFDNHLHLAVLRMTHPEAFAIQQYDFLFEGLTDETRNIYASLKTAYENNIGKVTALIDRFQSDKAVKTIIERYQLLKHFCAIEQGNTRAAAYYLSKAKGINAEASPLSVEDLSALETKTRKTINQLRELISDREAFKISLSFGDATSLVSVISSFFLISGYLYNYFLLGQFGIEVSKYFGLSDYLASSIDGISYSAYSAGLGLLSYFLGMHSASRKSRLQLEYEESRKDYWPYAFIVILIVGAILGYIQNSERLYECICLLIILAALYLMPTVARKYFEKPTTALFLLIFIASFSALMFAAVGKTVLKFRNYEFSKLNPYEVQLNEHVSLKDKEFIILAGNSEYFFFLDKDRSVVVVRKGDVLYLRQINK
jgi:hypothetical protein